MIGNGLKIAWSYIRHYRQSIALIAALAFHISGFIAIGLFKSNLFADLTPLNLMVCLLLIVYTQVPSGFYFWLFALLAFTLGYASEYIGVTTGVIFGDYSYGQRLGEGINGVPLIIGVQWLVTMYCIGMTTFMLRRYLQSRHPEASMRMGKWWMALSTISDGALLAVVFDWVIEPTAIKLGFWQWADGAIPWSNYLTWYVVSVLILLIFHLLPFRKDNLFAVHLFLIQFMFFLLLRLVL